MKILDKESKEITTLDFGIVEAGQSKIFEYFLYNNSGAEVSNIKVEIINKEVEILGYLKELHPLEKGLLRIRWSPSIKLKQGLKSLIKISGTELYK